jgi:hypothetical protein
MLTTFSGTVGGQVRQVLLYLYVTYIYIANHISCPQSSRYDSSSSSSSSVPFTPYGAQDIHEELPSVAISSYPLDLIPYLPVFLISSSIVLRHVLFGLPLLLYP